MFLVKAVSHTSIRSSPRMSLASALLKFRCPVQSSFKFDPGPSSHVVSRLPTELPGPQYFFLPKNNIFFWLLCLTWANKKKWCASGGKGVYVNLRTGSNRDSFTRLLIYMLILPTPKVISQVTPMASSEQLDHVRGVMKFAARLVCQFINFT